MTEDQTPPTFDREPRGGGGRKFAWMLPLALTGLVVVLTWKLYETKPADIGDVAAQPPIAQETALTFRGRIRVGENDSRPVANARVRWMIDRRAARTAAAALRLVGEGKTDADGRFALQRPPAGAEGYASVWCERPDGWALIAAGLQGPTQDIFRDRHHDYCPESRDSFIRMLVTGDGKPLVGARVELSLGDDCAPISELHPVTTTDARGMVEIHGLEGSEYWADISADGFAPVRMATHQWYGDDETSVDEHDLPRARTLHCRVAANDGSAPAGAAVEVSYESGRGGTRWFLPVGADGRLDILVPMEGSVALVADAPGFAEKRTELAGIDEIVMRMMRLRSRPAPDAPLVVVAEGCGGRAAEIPPESPPPGVGNGFVGRVAVGRDEPSIAGARVRWVFDARPARTADFAQRRIEESTIAADGTFALPTPAANEGNVSLWCERSDGWHLLGAGIRVSPTEAAGWDHGEFRVAPRADVVRVRVVDGGDAAITGARVELVLDGEGAPVGDRPPATTDANGTAEIRDLESCDCWVDVTAVGYAPVRVSVSQAAASDPSVSTITLTRARPLTCRVRTSGGSPPAGTVAEVGYERPDGRPGRWFLPVCRDGTFAAAVPDAGDVSLRVSAPGFHDATIDASVDVEEFVVDLVPAPK